MATNRTIFISGRNDSYVMFGRHNDSVEEFTNIKTIHTGYDLYIVKTKNLGIKIDHDNFTEIEFNILSETHNVKYDNTNDLFTIVLDEEIELRIKIGFDHNGMWIRICN